MSNLDLLAFAAFFGASLAAFIVASVIALPMLALEEVRSRQRRRRRR